MSYWPITTKEAARRLRINQVIAHTLVKALKIPFNRIGRANALDEASYLQLKEAARPFQAHRHEAETVTS